MEEIHTTLRKHLAKEEAQLLPLLLQHFSNAEQAELVAQFLYTIPLETVERVLSQLRPMIPKAGWWLHVGGGTCIGVERRAACKMHACVRCCMPLAPCSLRSGVHVVSSASLYRAEMGPCNLACPWKLYSSSCGHAQHDA